MRKLIFKRIRGRIVPILVKEGNVMAPGRMPTMESWKKGAERVGLKTIESRQARHPLANKIANSRPFKIQRNLAALPGGKSHYESFTVQIGERLPKKATLLEKLMKFLKGKDK